jgi:hypothetical protein
LSRGFGLQKLKGRNKNKKKKKRKNKKKQNAVMPVAMSETAICQWAFNGFCKEREMVAGKQ